MTARFKAGDTITNGSIYLTIKRVTPASYEVVEGGITPYIPVALVDRLWTLADDVEIED